MDIALALSPDGTTTDLAIANGDLALDGTLMTPILIMLQSDMLAGPDDVIPDGSTNRRGWWGDAYLPPLPDGTPYFLGSKLWLYTRCTATNENALLIQEAAQNALNPLIAYGIAEDVAVSTQWIDEQSLALNIAVAQSTQNGNALTTYSLIWKRTLGTIVPATGFPQ
jgi:phage gp46-like protein